MNAPDQVEITSLSFVIRPPTQSIPKGAAPRKLWLATSDAVFAVSFREDAWARPGASYTVKLPAPLRTSCLAVVLEEAYTKSPGADADVTLAEVTAQTEFDAGTDANALAAALAGGKERARMAAALLMRGGPAARLAAERVYPTLDDAGRLLALEVIDGATCDESAPIYLKAMQIGRPGEVHHATDRLVRCGRAGSPALSAALANGPDKQRIEAAKLLSLVAPDVAVEGIVKLLPDARVDLRSELRAALTRASQNPAGKKVAATTLSDASLSKMASIDLLRAAAAEPVVMPEASAALGRLLADAPDFRTRYLLLAPAAALAQAGDAKAQSFVLRSLREDADVHVRARAAEVTAGLPAALGPLAVALADPSPRVRAASLASITNLTSGKAPPASAELFASVAAVLGGDPFSFVRVQAADALLAAPPGEKADAPLAHALGDESPAVRARAVDMLGTRQAKEHAGDLRERLDDEHEVLDVRVRAARALGNVCDTRSVDRLTELAQQAGSDAGDGTARMLGAAAALALARLSPPDLMRRLAPLLDSHAPRAAQQIAKSALLTRDRCPKSPR
jgi:hypothetical protein